ncbi:MAG: single-stranded DNA-binding protein [Bacteroidetes bacterium]|nr:single-stranded DNA-binding protein [Bacteroidota bacterium]
MQDINVNKVVLIGRIEEEPVLRHTQTNTAICSFRVVVTETYVNRDGNPTERKSTHSVVVWGQKAETFKNQAHANSLIFVDGSIRNRSYEDREGNRKWVTEINAQNAFVLDAVSGHQTHQGTQGGYSQPQPATYQTPAQQTAPPSQQPPAQQAPPAVEGSSASHVPEDDLPF